MHRSRPLLVLLPFLLATAAHAAGWSYRSPEGTVGLSIAKAGNRLLLGTSQGLEVSDDDGANWSRLDTLPRWSQVNEIRVDPTDVQHWYVRYYDFVPTGQGPAMFYLEYIERVRETRDGGASWQILALPGEAATMPMIHPVAANTRMIWYLDATTNQSAMALSFDGGAHWTPISRAPLDPFVYLGIGLSDRHFVGLTYEQANDDYDARLYLSTDNLNSWSSPVATLRVSHRDMLQLFPRAGNAQQLYWADATTWGLPGRSGTVDLVTGAVTTFPDVPGLLTNLHDDPANPGTVLAQNLGGYAECNFCLHQGLWSLAPGATQWQVRGSIRSSAKRVNTDPPFAQWLDAANGAQWLTDSSTGVQRSDDAGATWQRRNTGTRAASISAVAVDPRNGDRLLAGRDLQSLQQSDDGGRSWRDVGGDVPQDVRSLARSPVDPDHLLATAEGGFYRSRDAGATWQRATTSIVVPAAVPGWRDVLWCANTDTHLLAQVGSTIFRSVDGGTNWASVAEGDHLRLESARRAPGRVYLLRSNNYAVTTDCGLSFTVLGGFGGYSRSLAVDPNDDRHLVSTGVTIPNQIASLRTTSDGGANWTTIMNPGIYSGRNGWIDACDRDRYTTFDFRVLHDTTAVLTPQQPALLSPYARVNAVDSQCIGAESVTVVGTPSGLWLRRAAPDQLFADGFGLE